MNKRANRVYWMLLIMMFLLGVSIAIDGIRSEKNSATSGEITIENNDVNISENRENSTEENTEETTEEEETTEGTTMDPVAVAQICDSFYSGQVFVGDSIMAGLDNYSLKAEAPQWLKNALILSKISWGIGSALNNDGPLFRGQEQSICTSLSEINPRRVFINLGINEMNGLGSPGYSIEKLLNKYSEFITQLKATLPAADIYIINITPCTAQSETAIFKNSTMKEFNNGLEEKCREWNVKYLDLASEFGDELLSEYSSDDYVHHNEKAYREIWIPFLERVAADESPEDVVSAALEYAEEKSQESSTESDN